MIVINSMELINSVGLFVREEKWSVSKVKQSTIDVAQIIV
jgi:hypothetical protein